MSVPKHFVQKEHPVIRPAQDSEGPAYVQGVREIGVRDLWLIRRVKLCASASVPCPVMADARIHDDSMQPCRWRRFGSELIAMAEGPHERVLNDIFRILANVSRRNGEQLLLRLFVDVRQRER